MRTTIVPPAVQQAIVLRTPQLAYVPSRMPAGYRYLRWRWDQDGGALRIWFRNRAGKEVVFVSAWQYGSCARGKEKTFRLGRTNVYWSHRAEEQQAWRCVTPLTDSGVRIQLTVATPQPPTELADVGLGRIVASACRVR